MNLSGPSAKRDIQKRDPQGSLFGKQRAHPDGESRWLIAARMRELEEGRVLVGRVVLGCSRNHGDRYFGAVESSCEERTVFVTDLEAEPPVVVLLAVGLHVTFEGLVADLVADKRVLLRDLEDRYGLPAPLRHVEVVPPRGGGGGSVTLDLLALDGAREGLPVHDFEGHETDNDDREDRDENDVHATPLVFHKPLGFWLYGMFN